jgi:hypothetical protein
MAKYADNSNNSDEAASAGENADASKLNESCRAECDSQIGSDVGDIDFSVDGSRPYF